MKYVDVPTSLSQKSFDPDHPEIGFKETMFLGRYASQDVYITDGKTREGAIDNIKSFVIWNPEAKNVLYQSRQSGFLGLGPYPYSSEKDDNYVY